MFPTDHNSNSTLNTTTSSPRISFSHNLDSSLIETFPYRSDSSSDFNFCVAADRIGTEASSADELFLDGLIRLDKVSPLETSPDLDCDETPVRRDCVDDDQTSKTKTPKVIVSVDEGCGEDHGRSPQSKSFWRIKRSSSLRCESTKQKTSFWSSLPLLSRSNSTGSVAKYRHGKQHSSQNSSQRAVKGASVAGYSSQKPPLKRNYGGAYDYGVRISPVLNVPPPFISKGTANLLGLGSFFGNDEKNKK